MSPDTPLRHGSGRVAIAAACAALIALPTAPALARTASPSARARAASVAQLRRAERSVAWHLHLLHRCLARHPHPHGRCHWARNGLRLAYARERALRRALTARRSGPLPGSPGGSGGSQHSQAQESAAPAQSGQSFEMGVVSGSAELWELPWISSLGAHTARLEFEINESVSQLEPVIEGFAKAGIHPLLLATFTGRLPSPAEARNVASWAAAFGPGGTFWRGRNLPAAGVVTDIEFGNETNNPWQYGGYTEHWWEEPSFIQRAEEYARRLEEAHEAIARTGTGVGLLAIADEYGGHTTWDAAMFRAVPELGQIVAGWTIHPYGPDWHTGIENMIRNTEADGAPSTVPIYVTEWGVSTDNGRCLSDNFGWNPCMTYQEAASALESSLSAMRGRFGSRLRAFYLYQTSDLRPSGASTEREEYFGALQSNGAPKGPYTSAVQTLLAQNP